MSMLHRPSAPQWISKWQNIFGTFQIECEKFLIFHDFSVFFGKLLKNLENLDCNLINSRINKEEELNPFLNYLKKIDK